MKKFVKIMLFLFASATLIGISIYLSINFVFSDNVEILSPSSTATSISNPIVNVYCGNTQQPIIINNTSITPSCVELPKPDDKRSVFSIRYYELEPFDESQKQNIDHTIEGNLIFKFPNNEYAVFGKVPVNQIITVGSCLCFTDGGSECHPFSSLVNKTPVENIESNWTISFLPDLCKQ